MTEYDDLIDSIRLDEVLDALDIGVAEITRGEHWASCPLGNHADVTPSFSVNEDKLVWKCFTCDEGGNLLTLVMQLQGLDRDEAIDFLLPYSDGDTDTDEGFMQQLGRYVERPHGPPKRTRTVTLPYFPESLLESLTEAPVTLLEKWHVGQPDTVAAFNVKYDEERHRTKKGMSYTGPALVIPHFFLGAFVGFQERWLGDRPDWLPKYTNSDNFPKAETLYNYDEALTFTRAGEPVFVVESAPTVWRLNEIGFGALGTFGASITEMQMRLLRGFTGGLILTSDNDPDFINKKGERIKGAGVRALNKTINALLDFVPIQTVAPPDKLKGDLADLDDDQLFEAVSEMKTVFHVAPRT